MTAVLDAPTGDVAAIHSKEQLLATLRQGSKDASILGWIVWWNIREVTLSKDQLVAALKAAGLDEKYAREHNYRATLLRALNSLEEERLIRRVKEERVNIVFQFTAEVAVNDPTNPHLTYKPEVVVTVDKEAYKVLENLADAIVSIMDPTTNEPSPQAGTIKAQIIAAFNHHKTTYKSSDLTRYIQKIFNDKADMLSLRPQGSIYFVPAVFKDTVMAVNTLVANIGSASSFEYAPLLDAAESRKMVGDSFAGEVVALFHDMDQEIKESKEKKKELTEQWVEHRLAKIAQIKKRIDTYDEVLGDRAKEINGQFDQLANILRPRILDIG